MQARKWLTNFRAKVLILWWETSMCQGCMEQQRLRTGNGKRWIGRGKCHCREACQLVCHNISTQDGTYCHIRVYSSFWIENWIDHFCISRKLCAVRLEMWWADAFSDHHRLQAIAKPIYMIEEGWHFKWLVNTTNRRCRNYIWLWETDINWHRKSKSIGTKSKKYSKQPVKKSLDQRQTKIKIASHKNPWTRWKKEIKGCNYL